MRVASILIIVLSGLLAACNRREARSACWTAIQKSRDAVVQGKLDEASKLLEQARSTCAGRSPDELRREAEREVQEAEASSKKAHAAPTQRFVDWATAPLERFGSSLTNVECAKHGEPGFGFCEAERQDSPTMKVRYWKTDQRIVRYTFSTEQPLECEDLGEYRQVRRWSVGQKRYELCEITQREARDLSALLVRAPGENQMYIFSFEYTKKDPSFEKLLRTP